ncbi:hypothetical protein [Janibacter sp. UYMM211]|uniref:hypothetical protein n=1 Tax=Janibacter sp. UYMM211 TaxID=3156342 RepID=UPI00339253A6
MPTYRKWSIAMFVIIAVYWTARLTLEGNAADIAMIVIAPLMLLVGAITLFSWFRWTQRER